jgi:hypothetical protein
MNLNNLGNQGDLCVIASDDVSEKILRMAGIYDDMKSMSHRKDFDTTMMRFSVREGIVEWDCLACYHWNQEDESENGFVITMLKKRLGVDTGKFLDEHVERMKAMNSRRSLYIPLPKDRGAN